MDFIPYTSQETQAILDDLGLRSKSDLFKSIPQPLLNPKISLPEPLTEWEITETMEAAASQNRGTEMLSFLGGGAYDHFIPAAVTKIYINIRQGYPGRVKKSFKQQPVAQRINIRYPQ